MSKYEIWANTHPIDGEYSTAFIMGAQEAESFNEAVEKFINTLTPQQVTPWTKCLVTDRWFYYGLEVYETEELAQNSKWEQLEREMDKS